MKGLRFKVGLPLVSVVIILSLLLFAVPISAVTPAPSVTGEVVKAVTLPTVTTQAASGESYNTATLNGNVTGLGDRYVMFKGFFWGTESGVYTKFWHEGSYWTQRSTGAYTHAPTNLVEGTTYYYKAYVTYRWGRVYGAEVSFTTTGAVAPTVTTTAAATITATSAILGGNLTVTGGGVIWWKGIQWGLVSGAYTDSWTKKSFRRRIGHSTGAYTRTISGLTASTTYYHRAAVCTLYQGGRIAVSLVGAGDGTAEWSTGQKSPLSPKYLDRFSVELKALGTGAAGSTHLEFVPIAGTTLTVFQANLTDYGFWHYTPAELANWAQFELRFEDPDSDGWVEITAVGLQNHTGSGAWAEETLAAGTLAGYGGWGEAGSGAGFSDWSLTAMSGILAAIDAEANVADCGPWLLERVRVELWETSPARICYIDDVTIAGTTYFIEGWSFSSWNTKTRNCYAGVWGYGAEDDFATLAP